MNHGLTRSFFVVAYLLLACALVLTALSGCQRRDPRFKLRDAILADDYDRARSLVSSGIDVNEVHLSGSLFGDACLRSSAPLCAMLIEFGGDVNKPQTNSEVYPIHLAALSGDAQKVWMLRNHGADVFVRNESGQTALFYAAWAGSSDVISILANWGLDVNAEDKDGDTPLLALVADLEGFRQLVQDFNSTQDDDSDRILDADTEIRERLDAIRTLVAWGADINAVNDAGECALSLAEAANETSLTEVLVELGAVSPAASENTQANHRP